MKTFVKHVYDIDLVNIYKLLDNKISNDTSEKGAAKKKDFFERLSFSVKQIFQSNKENYNLHFQILLYKKIILPKLRGL
jgi:hypothetical protein